jgi:TonB family protein
MSAANFLAYCAQITVVILACAWVPHLLGLRSPAVHYAFWRTVLAVCVALPLLQPWRPHEMVFVPSPVQPPPIARAAAPPGNPGAPGGGTPRDWTDIGRTVLVIGIGARLFWVGLGAMRLRTLRRRAARHPARQFEEIQAAVGTRAEILWSSDVRHPVTFGISHPVILLPTALRSAERAAQRAVLAHELAHVQRRDWLWVIGEEVLRSVFWFHPAMWWLVSRVQLARETVVDELSILVTNARRTYLDTLLAFADDTGLVSPPAFSARRQLFYRVMLLSKEETMSSIRVAVASCVLLLVLGAGAWEAVNAFPLYGQDQTAQKPPRDPLSPDAYHRRATEYMEKAQKDTTLTRDEKLETILKGIEAEDRALSIKPDYTPALVYKSVLLRMQAELSDNPTERQTLIREANELRERAIALGATLGAGGAAVRGMPPPPPPPPPPGTEGAAMAEEFNRLVEQYHPLRIGGNVKAPAKIRDVKPIYPPEAQANRLQGVVILEALIDGDGSVVDARVLRSIPMLDAAALDAVRQWRFMPSLLNGDPVPVLMTVTVNFTLAAQH